MINECFRTPNFQSNAVESAEGYTLPQLLQRPVIALPTTSFSPPDFNSSFHFISFPESSRDRPLDRKFRTLFLLCNKP